MERAVVEECFMKDIIFKLKNKLVEVILADPAQALLFSGGLDSSILAGINSNLKAITVNLESYGEDIKYALSVIRFFDIDHFRRKVDVKEALAAVPQVIKILKTFDLALPNDLTVYLGLKQAKELGIDEVMTGDGSDELFAGYSFMQEIDNLQEYIEKIAQEMKFSANRIGEFFKIRIVQPFLDKEFVDFSLRINPDLKIKKENSQVWGKWILRKAFEGILPEEILWQGKRPLECGSGMTKMRDIISSKVSDKEFKEAKEASLIKFINKEHYYYYQIYKDVVGDIPRPRRGEKKCPGCGGGMNAGAFHCKTCGNVLDWRI